MPETGGRWPSYTATIERIVEHTADIRSLFLGLPAGAKFTFAPGQFISMGLPLAGQSGVRPYTIASSPGEPGPLEIVLNLVPGGLGSAYLFARKPGDQLTFTGPFGMFTLQHPPDCETVFAAERTAIAPIRPMVKRALAAPVGVPMRLIYGALSVSELLYQSEFRTLSETHPEFQFESLLTPSGPTPAQTVLDHAMLARMRELYVESDQRRDRQFYLCGAGNGVLAIRDLLRGAGYPRALVHYEKW